MISSRRLHMRQPCWAPEDGGWARHWLIGQLVDLLVNWLIDWSIGLLPGLIE